MPLPPGSTYGDIGNESRPLLFFKKFLNYLIFCVFLINGIKKTWFWVTIHNDIYHSCADVGPWRPEGFPCHRWRGRGDDMTGVDAEQTLQNIHTNFVRLTHRVPMAQVEDLPEAMQR